jgi:hypothetical protein
VEIYPPESIIKELENFFIIKTKEFLNKQYKEQDQSHDKIIRIKLDHHTILLSLIKKLAKKIYYNPIGLSKKILEEYYIDILETEFKNYIDSLDTIVDDDINNVVNNVMDNVVDNVMDNVVDNVMDNTVDNVMDNSVDNAMDNTVDNVMDNNVVDNDINTISQTRTMSSETELSSIETISEFESDSSELSDTGSRTESGTESKSHHTKSRSESSQDSTDPDSNSQIKKIILRRLPVEVFKKSRSRLRR